MIDILKDLSSILWGPYFLIPLLLGVGVYLSFKLRGIQFRKLLPALRLGLIERRDSEGDGDISQYQALATALAATVGTGNIVGVATAIGIGGPGALFWMWVTGLLGMATKYSETFLAVRFRVSDAAGEKSGGPQYYLERGISGKLGKGLSLSFAVFTVIACFGIGNMTQGNAIANNVASSLDIPLWATGILLSLMTGIVLMGGIKWIGKVTASFVPVMILLYVLSGLFILAVNASAIPSALALVFQDAFTGSAATGGFLGSGIMLVMQSGVARGLFSNESGLGSAAMAAAAAKTTHPVRQGLVAMTQTFIDTIIVVSITGLCLVVTGAWQKTDPLTGQLIQENLMTGEAFSHGLPGEWGHWVVTLSIILFAYSTILGWSYYGERNVERLFGLKGVLPYRIFYSAVVFFGCTLKLDIVWTFSDIANGLMALPNLIGLVLLSGLVMRETRHYLQHDPGLHAGPREIEAFMKGQEGWEDWKKKGVRE